MKNNYNYKQSFFFGFIFNLLDLKLPENAEPIVNYSFGVLILSIIILFNIINAFTNLISLYLLNKYDVNNKFKNYPLLIKIIKFFEGGSLVNICIELAMCLICLLVIIISSTSFLIIFLK